MAFIESMHRNKPNITYLPKTILGPLLVFYKTDDRSISHMHEIKFEGVMLDDKKKSYTGILCGTADTPNHLGFASNDVLYLNGN